MFTITPAETESDLQLFRELCVEYARSLDFSLCFQGFDAEMAALPGSYAAPDGLILLGWLREQPAGCIAVRPLSTDICEMKRLWVRPEFRGQGLGRLLVRRLIADAEQLGYRAMRLDTIRTMEPAIRLYESFGFRTVAPYNANPIPDVVYLEKPLSPNRQRSDNSGPWLSPDSTDSCRCG